MPTLHFLLYLAVVGFAYLFKLSYLGWFGPYLLAAVIFVPLLLLFLSLPSMLSGQIFLRAAPYYVKQSDAAVQVIFRCSRFLPVSSVSLRMETENLFAGERSRTLKLLRSVSRGREQIPLPTELCGTLRCQITRFECRDLLGLISVRRPCPEPVYCTVLPAASAPDTALNVEAALHTPVRFKPKYGGGYSEEHDLREYRPGDTVNSIHWKLSSKTDEVIVREALERENQEIFLVLARVGAGDRGLEVLYWLSQALNELELPHIIVSDRLYSVGNETETVAALSGILSAPIADPCSYDAANVRCVFLISAGEVHVV